uniref:Uncharacterized protein n=1 Tax=Arundo donax TaxID=35708 RepID=A0A0A9HIS4_ARUDO
MSYIIHCTKVKLLTSKKGYQHKWTCNPKLHAEKN